MAIDDPNDADILVRWDNHVRLTLSASVSTSDLEVTVNSTTGAPNISATGEYFYAVLRDEAAATNEIVKVTELDSGTNTYTIVRDAATKGSYVSGDTLRVWLTAETLLDIANGLNTSIGAVDVRYVDVLAWAKLFGDTLYPSSAFNDSNTALTLPQLITELGDKLDLSETALQTMVGALSIGGALTVTGAVTLNGNVTIAADQTLTVTGDAVFNGDVSGGGIPTIPVGFVSPWMTTTPPDGWLICDGRAVNRESTISPPSTGYPSLYTVLKDGGTEGIYGDGDESTTFNLPDLRGMVLRGLDKSPTEGSRADTDLYRDPNVTSRESRHDGTSTGGALVGSRQVDDLKDHVHSFGTAKGEDGAGNKALWKADVPNIQNEEAGVLTGGN